MEMKINRFLFMECNWILLNTTKISFEVDNHNSKYKS